MSILGHATTRTVAFRRPLLVVTAVVAAGGVGLSAGWTAFGNPIDLDVYRLGGHAVLHHLPLYEQAAPRTGLPFTYTPFAALLFGPLAPLPALAAQILWSVFLVACLAVMLARLAPMAGFGHVVRRPLGLLVLAGAAVALEPVRHNFSLGQINIPLTLVVLLEVISTRRRRVGGVGLGVAAALKLTPLIFVPYLALAGRRADAVRATATFAAATLLGWAVAPSDSGRYWTRLAFDPSHTGAPEYVSNQSLCGVFSRLAGHPADHLLIYRFTALAVAAFGLALAAALARSGDTLAGAATCGVTGLLVSPISWTAHWLWVLPALAVLVRPEAADPTGPRQRREEAPNLRRLTIDGRYSRRGAAAAAAYAVFALGLPWWVPHDHHREFALGGWQALTADAYVLLGFAFLAAGAVRVWHRSGQRHPGAASIRHSARASVL